MTTALAPKTQLGRYQLVRHLASGGMADLWLARATGIEGFERHVAVKRIRQEQARDERFVQMFLDEARLAASLHHHNIATVHDIGQESGEYFFTMEYVHGEDLRKILMLASAREQYLPLEHIMTITQAATAALHYAHEHKSQIVHRDVSPANIIVGYDGNVKVVDFGIAKAAHRTKETQSGVMKGKVAYMSPEQCVGQPVDRRSDIFSLGIVLYELVTVRRLFKAANDFLTMSAIIHAEIPPPASLRQGVPRDLEAIIMKALAPDRDERFQTTEEMHAALERFCIANQIRTSSTALADYMHSLFGDKPEPWLADDEPELELTIDFDGTLPGVVKVPEAALKRYAVPATTPVQPSAPIMKARSKAITGAPPPEGATPQPMVATESQPATASVRAAEESTDIVTPLPLPLELVEHAELPRTDGPLSVGDQTLMVRAPTVVPRVGKQIAMIVVGAAAAIVIAFVVITKLRAADSEPATAPPEEAQARPDIRLPPPSNVTPAQPVVVPADAAAVAVTPDAAEATPDAAEATPDAAEEPTADVAETTGTQVKLRDPEGSTKKPKKKPQRPRKPPRGTDSTDAGWDPNSLFPEKK